MSWDIAAARRLYNIAHWSGGYFDIDDRGRLVALPHRDPARPAVDLHALAGEIAAAGLSLPVLVRFSDILHDRVDTLIAAFGKAMAAEQYGGGYTAVYPIKVNQQRRVVEEILRRGDGRVGLEAGSKPELMAVLALAPPGGAIVCNGYKDREYIRLALMGRRLGHRLFIVVEKLSELDLVIEEAAALGVEPLLGIRLRLSSIGAGKWQNTGGEKAKFGLSAAQVLEAVARLRGAGLLGGLRLMHFHMGSQISNIRDIQNGMREAGRYFAELHRLGAAIDHIDVGGGLGVDYEGTRSRSFCSINYTVEEYARNIVHALREAAAAHGLPHPAVFTECGRAMTAHHAVLITDVIDSEVPEAAAAEAVAPADDAPALLRDMHKALAAVSDRSAVEIHHDAAHWLGETQTMFTHGLLTLEEKALAERLYFALCGRVRHHLNPAVRAHRQILDELNERLADKYFCNFSLFQSLPDVWAIEQIFPVLPLHRLDEAPTRRTVIEDLTCDSDGRIDHYVDEDGIDTTLPLHPWRRGERYLLGVFLAGAYQETLGDIHNLFGDTDSVTVECLPDGSHRLTDAERGDTVEDVLRMVRYNPRELSAAYRTKVLAADLSDEQRKAFLLELEAGLTGYTYLED